MACRVFVQNLPVSAENPLRILSLDVTEFLHRFLQHVLPQGFVRIRHYGLLANCRRREKIEMCRTLLRYLGTRANGDGSSTARPSIGMRCRICHVGVMVTIEIVAPGALALATLIAHIDSS